MTLTLAQKAVYDAIKSLNGRTFNSREDYENAIYPLFGKLSSLYTGEGHRDLADRLINGGWVIRSSNGEYKINLPPSTDFEEANTNPTQAIPTTDESKKKSEAINNIVNGNYADAIKILSQLL